jgi:molybdenum cofactor cytidylyltransferase
VEYPHVAWELRLCDTRRSTVPCTVDGVPVPRIAAIVLAAGAGLRFGRPDKLLAPLRGRPILLHVLDAIAEAGFAATFVVVGENAERVERSIRWRTEVRVANPDPARGLSSSVQVGVAAARGLEPPVDGVLIALGDQPNLSSQVIRALVAAAGGARPIVVPRYEGGGGSNPVLVRREAWHLVDELTGDRGLGPIIEAGMDQVTEVGVEGSNPDVDTPDDLAGLAGQSSSG